jgi:DNA (cytosine-5)-methyltransferase 1
VKALDLFCCGGGASRGLARAGFKVTGVDIERQPGYPFEFQLGDALDADLTGYDLIWASPPCQGYCPHVTSRSSEWVPHAGKDEPRLIEPVREKLQAAGVPYVIENVRGARDILRSPIELCGTMFGLPTTRHRYFETSWPVLTPPHPKCKGVAKDFATAMGWEYRDMTVTGKGRHAGTSARWKLIGIEQEAQMTQHQLAEAVPPAYAQFIASTFLMHKASTPVYINPQWVELQKAMKMKVPV